MERLSRAKGSTAQAAEQVVELVDDLDRGGGVVDPGGQGTLGDVHQLSQTERHVLVEAALGADVEGAWDGVLVQRIRAVDGGRGRLPAGTNSPTARSTQIVAEYSSASRRSASVVDPLHDTRPMCVSPPSSALWEREGRNGVGVAGNGAPGAGGVLGDGVDDGRGSSDCAM